MHLLKTSYFLDSKLIWITTQRNNSWIVIIRFSDRDRIRTYDRLLRRQMLYPAELRDQKVGVAGFEPATSASQTRRDNRATLHPEKDCKYNCLYKALKAIFLKIIGYNF